MPTCRIERERREQFLLDPTRHQVSGSAQPTVPRSEEDSLGLALSPRLVTYMHMYALSKDRSLMARLGRPRARQAPLVVYVDPMPRSPPRAAAQSGHILRGASPRACKKTLCVLRAHVRWTCACGECAAVEEGSSSFLGFSLVVVYWCFLMICRLWPDCTTSLLRYKLENRLSLGGALCRRFVAVQTRKPRPLSVVRCTADLMWYNSENLWLSTMECRRPSQW